MQRTGGILTVDCDYDLTLVRRGHTIVGDTFVVLRLLPCDLCDLQELPLTQRPIYWHKVEVKGR